MHQDDQAEERDHPMPGTPYDFDLLERSGFVLFLVWAGASCGLISLAYALIDQSNRDTMYVILAIIGVLCVIPLSRYYAVMPYARYLARARGWRETRAYQNDLRESLARDADAQDETSTNLDPPL